MRIYDFVDEGLGHSSYVIDIGDGTTALVDPPRFPIAHETLTEWRAAHEADHLDDSRRSSGESIVHDEPRANAAPHLPPDRAPGRRGPLPMRRSG